MNISTTARKQCAFAVFCPLSHILQMNERIFGMYPAYREAVAAGSATPVTDALAGDAPDKEMLAKVLQVGTLQSTCICAPH